MLICRNAEGVHAKRKVRKPYCKAFCLHSSCNRIASITIYSGQYTLLSFT